MRSPSVSSFSDPATSLAVCSVPTAIAALAFFSDWALTTFAVPLFPSLGASAFVTGVLFATKSFVQLFAAPMVSKLSVSWIPSLSLLFIGLFFDMVIATSFALTHDLGTWFVIRGAQGVGSSFVTVGALGQLSAHYKGHDEQCGRAMSIAITGLIIGAAFGPVIAGTLAEVSTISPFAYLNVPLLVTLILSVVHRLCKGEDNLGDAEAEGDWLVLIKDNAIAYPLGVMFLSNAAQAFLSSSWGVYSRETWGFSIGQVGQYWCFDPVACIIGSFLAGHAATHFKRGHLQASCCMLMAIFLTIGPKTSFATQATCMAGFGTNLGVSAPLIPAMLAAAAENHAGTSAVYAMQDFAEQLAFLVGPVLGTAVFEKLGFWTASVMFAVPLCAVALFYGYQEATTGHSVSRGKVPNYGAIKQSSKPAGPNADVEASFEASDEDSSKTT